MARLVGLVPGYRREGWCGRGVGQNASYRKQGKGQRILMWFDFVMKMQADPRAARLKRSRQFAEQRLTQVWHSARVVNIEVEVSVST